MSVTSAPAPRGVTHDLSWWRGLSGVLVLLCLVLVLWRNHREPSSSWQSRALLSALRSAGLKSEGRPRLDPSRAPDWMTRALLRWTSRRCGGPPRSWHKQYHLTVDRVLGFEVYRLRPRDRTTAHGAFAGHRLMFVHGGAYLFTMSPLHWRSYIAWALDTMQFDEVVVPLYGVATRSHTFAEMLTLLERVYVSSPSSRTVLMGDSAGAHACLALCKRLSRDGRDLPYQLVLCSPWLDPLNDALPASWDAMRHDPCLSLADARLAIHAFTSPNHEELWPLDDTFRGLEGVPVLLISSDKDMLVAQARHVSRRHAETVVYLEYPGQVHDFLLLSSVLPEARQAFNDMEAHLWHRKIATERLRARVSIHDN